MRRLAGDSSHATRAATRPSARAAGSGSQAQIQSRKRSALALTERDRAEGIDGGALRAIAAYYAVKRHCIIESFLHH